MSRDKELFDYQYELLLKEVDHLQSAIREYDKILFTIKGWSITVFAAFVAFMAREGEPVYLAVAGLAVILFWMVDAIYKSFQERFLSRYEDLETFLRNDFPSVVNDRQMTIQVPDLRGSASGSEKQLRDAALEAARLWQTFLLYSAMLIMLFFVWVIERVT